MHTCMYLLCMYVFLCSHALAHLCICTSTPVCMCVCGGQRLTSSVFLPCSPCHIWRQSLPLEPRSCHFNKASEPACFWGYPVSTSQVSGMTVGLPSPHDIYVGPGDSPARPHGCLEVLCLLNHLLSSPIVKIFIMYFTIIFQISFPLSSAFLPSFVIPAPISLSSPEMFLNRQRY